MEADRLARRFEGADMNEQMGWVQALIWGTVIVAALLGLLVVAYLAFEKMLLVS